MLLQLEDIIALNHSIFSDSEYSGLVAASGEIRSAALKLFGQAKRITLVEHSVWEKFGFDPSAVSSDIVKRCDSVLELCRKASFLHLKSSLTEGVNLEVNQDKYVVEGFLDRLGFSKPLLASLNEAEQLNRASSSALELKSSLGHLRSFIETLHLEAVPKICATKNLTPPTEAKWGSQLYFLSSSKILTEQEEKLVAGLARGGNEGYERTCSECTLGEGFSGYPCLALLHWNPCRTGAVSDGQDFEMGYGTVFTECAHREERGRVLHPSGKDGIPGDTPLN
jgi:hypothetical protein